MNYATFEAHTNDFELLVKNDNSVKFFGLLFQFDLFAGRLIFASINGKYRLLKRIHILEILFLLLIDFAIILMNIMSLYRINQY